MKKEGTPSYCSECGAEFYIPPSARKERSFCSRKCKGAWQSKARTQDLGERFWTKVEKTDSCWLWRGALLKTGYGSIRIAKKAERAHRVAYELSVGPIPAGAVIRHSCDTPACVNPAHLLVGTAKENVGDAMERGRFRVGERDAKAKLSNMDVATIRAALAAGATGRYVAKLFGVSESHICYIKRGIHRKHG